MTSPKAAQILVKPSRYTRSTLPDPRSFEGVIIVIVEDDRVTNHPYISNGTAWVQMDAAAVGGGAGDVLGPVASTDNELALFSGTGGKTLKRSNAFSGFLQVAAGIISTLTPSALKTALGLSASDVGLGSVTNESKATMFTSPVFTGTPAVPTPGPGDNSTAIASTAYTTAAIAAALSSTLNLKGGTNLSGNPNYPAAVKGDLYYVTTAGKIGGASGLSLAVGDAYVASVANAGGTQAAVGASWFILSGFFTGSLLAANNLSDLVSVVTAWNNLGGPARVLGQVLTGFAAVTPGPVLSSNTVLEALQLLESSKQAALTDVALTSSRDATVADFGHILVPTGNFILNIPTGLTLTANAVLGLKSTSAGTGTATSAVGNTNDFPGTAVPINKVDFIVRSAANNYTYEGAGSGGGSGVTVPTMTWAIANATPAKIVGTPSIPMFVSSTPAFGDFTVTKAAAAWNPTAAAWVSGNLELTMPSSATAGQAVLLTYAQSTSRMLSKVNNQPVPDLAAVTVTNNVSASVPGQVTGLTLGTPTSSTQPLTWSVPAGTPTDYIVEYKQTSSGTFLTYADGTSTTPAATVTGLSPSTSYDYRVRATNGAGNGAVSSTVTGSTTAAVTTQFIRQTSLTGITETGDDGPTGRTYTSTAEGNTTGSNRTMTTAEDYCSVEATASALLSGGGNFFGTAPSNAFNGDLTTGNYFVNIRLGNSYQVFEGVNLLTVNVPGSPNGAVGHKIRLGKAGLQAYAEIFVSSAWQKLHVFSVAPPATMYPASHTFDSGNALAVWIKTIGSVDTHWADQTVNVVADGNSLMVREDGGGTMMYKTTIKAPIFGSRATFTNVGVDGQTTRQMNGLDGGSVTDVDAAWVSGKINVLVIWEGTNSIAGGRTATQAATDLSDYITARQAVHTWNYVVVVNTIQRQGGLPDGATLTNLNIALADYNTYLATNRVAMGISVIANVRPTGGPFDFTTYTDAGFGAAASASLWYDTSPNRLHLNDAGYEVISNYLVTAIKTLGIA